jgi:hypothetical protein
MKKKVGSLKLTLHRETLRALEAAALGEAAAGGTVGTTHGSGRDYCSIAWSKCDCTRSFDVPCPV